MKWQLNDGYSTTTVEATPETLGEEVGAWVRGGDWDTSGGYVYVDVRATTTDDDGDELEERITVAIEPPEPECTHEDGHDWASPYRLVGGLKENPGVWGKGAGVVIHEVCMHCGCGRTTDTWAQRHDTGQQGLEEITYEPRKYRLDELEEVD